MNPFMRRSLKSPFSGMNERMMRAQMEAWRFLYPEQYEAAMRELSSMDRESLISRLRSMAREKGIDLDRMAESYGIKL